MKKIISILLCAVMLSVYFTVFTVTAMASEVEVYDTEGLINALDNIQEGDTINVKGHTYLIDDDTLIKISKPCTINFYDVYLRQWNGESDSQFHIATDSLIEVNAHNVTLNFWDSTFSTEKYDEAYVNERGSAIHVDGDNCVIDGHGSTNFVWCKTNAKYGGAIYIDDGYENCQIRGCNFAYCTAAEYGGAIFAASDGCVITDCRFIGCKANGVDSFVYGEEVGQTKLVNCTDFDGNPCNASNCPGCVFVNASGFTLSEGNMAIIVGAACLVVGAFGGFLIGTKKKKTAA